MGFTVVPDRAAGYAPLEADWDTYIRDNFNTGTWTLLGSVTATGSSAAITFGSIPGTYKHLYAIIYGRTATAATLDTIGLRVNADTGANYDREIQIGTGSTNSSSEAFGLTNNAPIGPLPAASAAANLFGCLTCWIPNYANTANNKGWSARATSKIGTSTGQMWIYRAHGQWRSNAAVTQLDFIAAGNIVSGSNASLFGLA